MKKQITLMPDHGCSPLWVYIGHEFVDNPDPDELPVTSDLREALVRWSAVYEGTLDLEYPAASGFATAAEESAFDSEGQRLWGALQAELGPEYVVSYRSYREARVRVAAPGPHFAPAHAARPGSRSAAAGARHAD